MSGETTYWCIKNLEGRLLAHTVGEYEDEVWLALVRGLRGRHNLIARCKREGYRVVRVKIEEVE